VDRHARARRIVALFADNPGMGVVGMDGEMLDMPHLRRAERILAQAAAAGMASGAARWQNLPHDQ
jgi:citrate lyase subunit beta / citryl-CoA lyase